MNINMCAHLQEGKKRFGDVLSQEILSPPLRSLSSYNLILFFVSAAHFYFLIYYLLHFRL